MASSATGATTDFGLVAHIAAVPRFTEPANSGILVAVIEKACPGCGEVVRCVPESHLHAAGPGLTPSIEFEEMSDGRWVGYLVSRQSEPRGVPLDIEPFVHLHECARDDDGDGAGDRALLQPSAPLRSMGAERDVESPAP